MHVRVNDVNEFSPVFVERRYEASVPEGRLFDRIVRVEAVDADCSPQYSQICFYDIITPNVPFTIDNDGENYNCQHWLNTDAQCTFSQNTSDVVIYIYCTLAIQYINIYV